MAAYRKQIKEEQYRYYVTDALKVISENTAKFAGGDLLTIRYYDIINKKEEKEKRTADDIINDMKNKIAKFGKEVS